MSDETGSLRRDFIGSLFPRRLTFFDRLNANVEFVRVRRLFRGLPIFPGRLDLHRHIAQVVQSGPIDYLELGVWRGETLGLWAKLHPNPDSRLFGFDTFTGLPEDWADVPRGTFTLGGQLPDIHDPRVHLVPGLFQETLPRFLDTFRRRPTMVVHIDCDLYSSTLFSLATVDRVLSLGDFLIFDDFYSLEHEFQAFLDYRRSFYRALEPIAAVRNCTQVAYRVTRDDPTAATSMTPPHA